MDSKALSAHWAEYTAWLAKNAPEAFANLAPSAAADELKALADAVGPPLPDEFVTLLGINNGQRDPNGCCVLPGLEFLSTTRIIEEWQQWQEFREGETPDGLESLDDYARALDPGVLDKYTHAGWVPAFKDGGRADYVGFDMAPDVGGTVGQVINFGRDEDKHFIAFPALAALLAFWVALVQEGDCRVEHADAPGQPTAWFAHKCNGIDLLRGDADRRRMAESTT